MIYFQNQVFWYIYFLWKYFIHLG